MSFGQSCLKMINKTTPPTKAPPVALAGDFPLVGR